jgi:aryl-alcohol dehydrogenase-like predicted oxidoreductase
MFETVDTLQEIARDVGLSLTTLAVAWVLAHPAVTAPIIGASRPEQLDDTIAAVDVVLDDDVKARLDELTTQYRMGDAAR